MEQLDQTITLWLNGLHCPFTDGMWLLFSNRTVWIPLYLLGAGPWQGLFSSRSAIS